MMVNTNYDAGKEEILAYGNPWGRLLSIVLASKYRRQKSLPAEHDERKKRFYRRGKMRVPNLRA